MRQLLSDIEKLGCGCHTRAPKQSVAAVTPGHPNQSLCPVCVGVQRRELEDTFVVYDSFYMAFQINLSIVILVSFFLSGFLPQLCSTVCTTEKLTVPVNAGVQIHALLVNVTAALIDALPTVVVR